MPQTIISPFVMVIFGATGDLTARKLAPALYNLFKQGLLPDRFFVVGMSRRPLSNEEFRQLIKDALLKYVDADLDNNIWQKLSANLFYTQGLFEASQPYKDLVDLLATFDKEIGACITRFFYLATPPQNYSVILKHLDTSKLSEGCGQGSSKWTRVLIEKPFGNDLSTAKKLEEQLSYTFSEKQIYRIDHYLAKETIQNILAFRFANGIFEPLWNKNHIDNIQITVAEMGGVGSRGKFYEGVGALRDIVQNHLMAMLAFTAMEEPIDLGVDAVRAERVKVLQQIVPMTKDKVIENVARGQYIGYRSEKNINPVSCTETYVALKLLIDTSRWQGVPFYLRTGKRLPRSAVRISVQFKKPINKLFKENIGQLHSHENVLTFRVQPREGISLQMLAKEPGLGFHLRNVKMNFSYEQTFGNRKLFDSYERLLIDSIRGDQLLFATNAGFNATWEVVNKVMSVWEDVIPAFPNYEPGSWGPAEAEQLIKKDGRHWLLH